MTVDEYIASFPEEVREVLEQVRRTIHAAAPGAGEKISYQIPTITLDDKPLMYFSGWKAHIAVYPLPPLDDALAIAIDPYRSGKGTLKFPLNKPIPYDLITRLTQAFVAAR
ncbi:iron chaperone [Kribbella sp. NPDC058693]|uniref:iron chaperone n=1 Tax=Kribbella sp. NPDC058693 TaxID=3346602 RepID=UPI003665E1A7